MVRSLKRCGRSPFELSGRHPSHPILPPLLVFLLIAVALELTIRTAAQLHSRWSLAWDRLWYVVCQKKLLASISISICAPVSACRCSTPSTSPCMPTLSWLSTLRKSLLPFLSMATTMLVCLAGSHSLYLATNDIEAADATPWQRSHIPTTCGYEGQHCHVWVLNVQGQSGRWECRGRPSLATARLLSVSSLVPLPNTHEGKRGRHRSSRAVSKETLPVVRHVMIVPVWDYPLVRTKKMKTTSSQADCFFRGREESSVRQHLTLESLPSFKQPHKL